MIGNLTMQGKGIKCSIEDWLPILNWDKMPNLGHCHTIEDDDTFMNNYHVSRELEIFIKNILMILTGDFELNNMRIMGSPGCGKTSFLSYLIRQNNKNAALLKYYFYRFRANRVTCTDIENAVMESLIDAWTSFYNACKKDEIASRINLQNTDIKTKINRFIDIYNKTKSEFNKKFIFIIDNADLLKTDEIYAVAESVMRHMKVPNVKKWLMIRECTYNDYDKKTKNLIDGSFPDLWDFPKLHVYDIINHRIKNQVSLRSTPKYPFSEELCLLALEQLFNGNMRETLSFFRNILEYSPPKGIVKETDEKFIQNFITKNSINAILRLNIVPNLYNNQYKLTPK